MNLRAYLIDNVLMVFFHTKMRKLMIEYNFAEEEHCLFYVVLCLNNSINARPESDYILIRSRPITLVMLLKFPTH